MFFRQFREMREARRRQQRREANRKMMTAFTVGGLLSGITALLFAPKSGKELRKDIADKAAEGAEFVKDGAVKLAGKTQEIAGEALKAGKNLSQAVGEKIADTFGKRAKNIEETDEQAAEKSEE